MSVNLKCKRVCQLAFLLWDKLGHAPKLLAALPMDWSFDFSQHTKGCTFLQHLHSIDGMEPVNAHFG